jgi:glucose-1-phosphate adenylyltransferase
MKTLAFVLAGGSGTRLHPLTTEDSKPALPFADGYRIVDFVLSNLVNSGITSIYVLAQYKPQSLIRHIDTVWMPLLARRKGFIRTLLPQANGAPYRGTADAVFKNLALIHHHRPDLVAVFAADHIYRMDVAQMACFHEACGADVTVSAARVPIGHASSFGVLQCAPDGTVLSFQEKPREPAPIPGDPARAYASMGNYLFDPDVLAGLLLAGASCGSTDFGHDILPRLPGRQRIYAYDFARNYVPGVFNHEERGYWRDVGTLEALRDAQNDVRGTKPIFNLWNVHWPVYGAGEELHAPVLARNTVSEKTGSSPLRLTSGAPQPRASAV